MSNPDGTPPYPSCTPPTTSAYSMAPYSTPRAPLGTVLTDEARDCEFVVRGLTDARIPCPSGSIKMVVLAHCVGFSGLIHMPTSAFLAAAALQVLDESPPLGHFPRHALKPSKRSRRIIREAGWPVATASVSVPIAEHTDESGKLWPATRKRHDIVVVPESWLLRMIELTGMTYGDLCDGRYLEVPNA